ncbi:GTPase family protein [Nonomuraea africana]|uniref:GTP-binding protein EngB required for normal cell division n=1 Tax=Nonomuraea africana TaxID=46171 RepID=A0ABR9KPQ0_9ACTN|nr:YfjP family GTPase [Nonomuraea africana]MBE1563745.1 GTP-binding protein EngB required for normal cell division [Nonomuraea africana]
MKLLRRKEGPSLDDRLTALLEAARLAEGRLAPELVAAAREVSERAGARRSLSVDHTVAALAGATGSGKSSLFNALTGADLAKVGVTRPTTSTAQAALWDGEGAGPLLTWLDVPYRHEVEGDLSGLVLLDLPDHDSIELTHRLEVDRLVELVDLLVWVVDPQKYADAALHERYLRPLSRHKEVMVVVLNQIDRLTASQAERCLADLRRLLGDDGLTGVPVLGASARTGSGLPELRGLLEERVSRRRSWGERLTADVATAAAHLAGASAAADPGGAPDDGRLTRALSEAAGVPLVVDAVAKAHTHRAVAATGWPMTRWMRRFRPDPLRRLGIDSGARGEIAGRTSVPPPSAVQKARMETAIRDVGEAAARDLPESWAAAVRQAARSHDDDLAGALDRVVATTSAGAARRPRWWAVVGGLQWMVFAAMVLGAVWLGVLFVLTYLRLPEPPLPTVVEVPWPTVLLIGGAVAGVLIALLSRLAAWAGGRRRARRVAKALRAGVAEVGGRLVLGPVSEELDRYRDFTKALDVARS